jgi:hypothetical protein
MNVGFLGSLVMVPLFAPKQLPRNLLNPLMQLLKNNPTC